MTDDRKKNLPAGAKRNEYPLFYWVNAPLHCLFANNDVRVVFNKTMNVNIRNTDNMRTVKIKEIWSFDNMHLTNMNGSLTSIGVKKYWRVVDAAVKYNVIRHEHYLRREQKSVYSEEDELPHDSNVEASIPQEGNKKRKSEQQQHDKNDKMYDFFKKKKQDKFHWYRNPRDRCRLPKVRTPPKARRQIKF